MTVNVTLNNLTDLNNQNTAVTLINNNNAAIVAGFTTSMNTQGDKMLGTLDMNSNQMINLPAPATANSPVRLVDVTGSGPTLTVPPVGTSGAVVGFLNANLTFSGTDSFNTVTITTATISTANANTMTASTAVVSSSLSTPNISGCFGVFRADFGGSGATTNAQVYTTPSPNTYFLLKPNVIGAGSSVYSASTGKFTPPASTQIVNLDAAVWISGVSSPGNQILNSGIKWIKNWTVDGNGFLVSAGTDIGFGFGNLISPEGGSVIATTVSARSSCWDNPSSSDYYGLFVFCDLNIVGTGVTIDGNRAHTYISGMYFV